MKLVAVSMVKNEEYWIWYSVTSVYPHVDEILVFDNYSEDSTLDVLRGMDHLGDKLVIWDEFGGKSEHENREHILDIARCRGATHLLFLDGDEVHAPQCLAFCRRLLEVQEHAPALHDPPANHMRTRDHTPTDGVLIKNIGIKPIHPGFAGPDTCRPQDLAQPDTDHGCYNFAIRIASVQNLRGNGLEWGRHGFVETGDLYIQSSPHTLWLPRIWYYHFSWHPRSSVRRDAKGYSHAVHDFGSVPLPSHVHLPEVLLHPDGPSNPTLEHWGIAPRARGSRHSRAATNQAAG